VDCQEEDRRGEGCVAEQRKAGKYMKLPEIPVEFNENARGKLKVPSSRRRPDHTSFSRLAPPPHPSALSRRSVALSSSMFICVAMVFTP
jgi:hypothetical protein